jgi:hypothetical protein
MIDLAADMDNILLDSGLEESVVYTMYNSTLPVAVTCKAHVFRGTENYINLKNPKNVEVARKFNIEIYLSRTDVTSVKISADTVQCKRLPTDSTNSTFRVAGIIRMDAGAWRLGLA